MAGTWQKLQQEKRLEHQLELQTRQIETVLSENELPGEVAGGYVDAASIRFDLVAHVENGFDKLKQVKNDLVSALGAKGGLLTNHGEVLQLHIKRPESPPVALLDMLPILPDLPPLSLTLGMSEAGEPTIVSLSDEDLSNILIAGDANAGKTSLLRTMGLSLALTLKQSQLQLLVIDGSTGGELSEFTPLEPLTYLPHMLSPVAYDKNEYETLIEFLTEEMRYRDEQLLQTPAIVVLVDEFTEVQSIVSPKYRDRLTRLVQKGPAAGIYHIVTTSDPKSEFLNRNFRLNLPVRLLGQLNDPEHAFLAADGAGLQTDYLLGKGDFLAVINDEVTHFQAAYIGDYDLHLTLDTLHRNRPRPLLATPVSPIEYASVAKTTSLNRIAFDSTGSGIHVIPQY